MPPFKKEANGFDYDALFKELDARPSSPGPQSELVKTTLQVYARRFLQTHPQTNTPEETKQALIALVEDEFKHYVIDPFWTDAEPKLGQPRFREGD